MTLTYTEVWILILGCAALTALIKAFGPVLLGGREISPWFTRVIVLMAPTLLCALVVTSVFDGHPCVRFGCGRTPLRQSLRSRTTVEQILSANVCRLSSHRGHR